MYVKIRGWDFLDVAPGKSSLLAFEVEYRLIHLLSLSLSFCVCV